MTNDKEAKTNTKKNGTRKQNSDEASQKESGTGKSGKRGQSNKKQVTKKEVNISSYVSNEDKNVYAITGLPEEFIATLFAWVSRSPKSFREHLQEAVQEFEIPVAPGNSFEGLSEKAKNFHEKWTVGYGHSSVAEHAVAHVGIESISRLASAELELANTFLSITEYSQRYQKPERGKWHNPFKGNGVVKFTHEGSYRNIENFFNQCFDTFEKLIKGVHKHLVKKEQEETGKLLSTKRIKELEKLAFEDARYALPLSMHTQLGMTANGRAWRDALAILGNSKHTESVNLANDLREEITKVLPVLLKYATPSQYQINSKKRMNNTFTHQNKENYDRTLVQLHSVETEETLINKIVALLKQKYENMTYGLGLFATSRMSAENKEKIVKDLLFEMEHFDQAPDVFNHIRYNASFLVSEANWHQLLRHNRKTDFTFSNPSPCFGITIPPRIIEAGLDDLMECIARKAQKLYNKLMEDGFDKEAEYVILNAHRRHVYASFSLSEAYHLINLRTSEEAQWDIRETFEDLYKQMSSVHPLLMSQAKRRL